MSAAGDRATDVVMRAANGELGQDGADLLALFQTAATQGRAADNKLAKVTREANALAAVLADVLVDAARNVYLRGVVDPVIDDLPWDARQRVQAYRFKRTMPGVRPVDYTTGQRVPEVPPRASVMRERKRVVDVEVGEPDRPV